MTTPPVNARKRRRAIAAVGTLVVAAATMVTVGRAGADEADSGGWTTSAAVSPAVATPGSTVTFTISVEADRNRTALVDFELYDAQWKQVHQEIWDDVTFRAGAERSFDVTWKVPSTSAGELRARLGVFSPGWGQLLHWNDQLMVIGAPGATSPSAPATTVAPTTTVEAATPPPPVITTPATTPAPSPATKPAPAPAPGSPPPSGSQFTASFETAEDFYGRFQLGVHFRGVASGAGLDSVDWSKSFSGDHDMSCGAPTTQREIHAQEQIDGTNRNLEQSQLFWWCAPGGDAAKGHVMTGMGDIDGYTILSFAPDQSFVDPTEVCWDVNLTRNSPRKWISVAVIPESVYQANDGRLDYIGAHDVDEFALLLPEDGFMFTTWEGFAVQNPEMVLREDGFSTTDKAKRYRHCLVDNGDGTVTISQERDGLTHERTVSGSFPDQARVIFLDDNYTPDKDNTPLGYTWHWDNITVS